MTSAERAARLIQNAWRERKKLVEQPIRDALEEAGYGFAALVCECEARGFTVTYEVAGGSDHLMIWRQPPDPPERYGNAPTPKRPGDLVGSWIDSGFPVDHLARCLRAELAVVGGFPGGWEHSRIPGAIDAAEQIRAEAKAAA